MRLELLRKRARIKELGQERNQQLIETQLARLKALAAELQLNNRELEEEKERIEPEQPNLTRVNQLLQLGRAQLEALRKLAAFSSFAGARLARVEIDGLTDSSRAELGARLSIRVGETLTTESIRSAMAAIHEFDPRLECRFVQTDDADVALQIIAPGPPR